MEHMGGEVHANEAAQFEKENGNNLLANKILKEMEALMSMKVFKKSPSSLRKARVKGYQFAPLRMILVSK